MDILLGSPLNLIIFYGLFTKINFCYLCCVMKVTLIDTTTTIKRDGQGS